MEFDVYFRIGSTCCGPFPAEAKNVNEMLDVAAGYQQDFALPTATIILISPKNLPPIWGHPGAKRCGNLSFGAKMGPNKEPLKAVESQGLLIINS
ncbi:hypothetical protein [Aeromonas finlandensis]|uniref:hypothetical protein n=1 Tax=Aeromonas finlandensis TaxID=1543375 RepID=UPI0012E025B4|nr:hypothetical protein [Aeromonas finlandensis]